MGTGESNWELTGSGDSTGEYIASGVMLDLIDFVGDLFDIGDFVSPASERRGFSGGRGDTWLVFGFGSCDLILLKVISGSIISFNSGAE